MSSVFSRLFAASEIPESGQSSNRKPHRRSKGKQYFEHDNYQYDVSQWNSMLHEVRTQGGGILAKARRKIQNVVADSNLDDNPKGAVKDAIDTSTGFSRELFSRLYGNPSRLPDEDRRGPDWMREFQDRVADLPEWKELRKSVSGDADFAAIASAGIMDRLADDLGKYMEHKRDQDESDDGESGMHGVAGLTAEDGLMASVAQACSDTSREVKDAKSAMVSLIPGSEAVPSGTDQEDPARMDMAERLLRMPDVRDLIERCGRIQRIASRSRPSISRDPEEITGIAMGDDIQYMLLSEAIDLLSEDLEALFYMRYAERGLLQYDRESVEPQGRGPMVVLLDESGSMRGDNHSWARAIGAACIAMAIKENRQVTIVGFNSNIRSVHHISSSGDAMILDSHDPGNIESRLGAGRLMMQVLTQNCGGGTCYDTVLQYALSPHLGVREDKADLIFVTDDACSVSKGILSHLSSAKEESGLRIYGMTIGGGSLNGAVQSICDEVLDLNNSDVGDKVGRAFSSL